MSRRSGDDVQMFPCVVILALVLSLVLMACGEWRVGSGLWGVTVNVAPIDGDSESHDHGTSGWAPDRAVLHGQYRELGPRHLQGKRANHLVASSLINALAPDAKGEVLASGGIRCYATLITSHTDDPRHTMPPCEVAAPLP